MGEGSSIKLKSNITLKSKYNEYVASYLPIDLMPKEFWDRRLEHKLTKQQKLQRDKKLFWAEKIVDEE